MRIPNPLLYSVSAGLYLACVYGTYSLVPAKELDAHPIVASIKTYLQKTIPGKQESINEEPLSPTPATEVESGNEKDFPDTRPARRNEAESMETLAAQVKEAGIDVNAWQDLAQNAKDNPEVAKQMQAMAKRAAQAGIDMKDLDRLAATGGNRSAATTQLKALAKNITGKSFGEMTNNPSPAANVKPEEVAVANAAMAGAASSDGTAPSISPDIVSKAIGNLSDSIATISGIPDANVKPEEVAVANAAMAGAASSDGAAPPISPDVVSKAMGDLSANVATVSGIPDAIKDAVSQSGIQGREIDPTKEYFADKPPVTAASLGNRAPSAEGGSKNSVAENLQILAAAGKGLADMAGNFSAPGAAPGNAPASDPAASEPPASTDAPEKTEEPATSPETPPAPSITETENPGKSWGTGQKRFAFVLVFLAGAALLHSYWKKGGKSSKKSDANLKKKYNKAHQLGWEENFQMAQNVLNEILKDYPKELDARFYLAGILWRKLNEPEEALEEYKKLEREIARQAVDYRYEDELKQNIEQLTEEIFQKSGVS